MKQLLSLAIALLPCLAWAQYPSNGNQKITLGEQTTADGLIYRGVAATDTVRKPSIDTMAYMVLDTTTNIMWHYKKATSNAWLRLNLLPSDTASMLTNYYRSGRTGIIQASDVPTLNQNTTGSAATLTTSRTFQTNLASTSTASFNGSANVTPGVTGTLPVANGGTGSPTQNFVDLTTMQTVAGIKTYTSRSNVRRLDITGTGGYEGGANFNSAGFYLQNTSNTRLRKYAFFVDNNGVFQILDTIGGATKMAFDTNNNVKFFPKVYFIDNIPRLDISTLKGVDIGTNADGDFINQASDIRVKNNVKNINYGLNEILNINPVSFFWNDENINIDNEIGNLGFIAQDVLNFIPEAVKTTGNDILRIDYDAITATLTKAIQEQQALIKALEQRIINLENK